MNNTRSKKLREWRTNAAILLISATLAMFVAELAARALFPSWAPRTGRVTKFWQYDESLGWSHKPNTEGRFESFGFDTVIRINSHGFRGPERSFEKPANKKRIIVIGDSFVWGFGVEEDQIFTQKLDRDLGPDVEVINLGVSGYSTDQELLMYRDTGRKYDADVVLLMVATNDVALNARPEAYVIYPKPVFTLVDSELRLTNHPVPVKNWFARSVVKLAGHSYVLNQLNRTRETWNVQQAVPNSGAEKQMPKTREFPRTPAETITIGLIEQLRNEVLTDGAEFLVVLVDDIYAGENFGNSLAERNIDFVALDDVMAGVSQELHLPDNLHWNASGHVLVANAIGEKLRLALERSRN